jgi:hypothetical protein
MFQIHETRTDAYGDVGADDFVLERLINARCAEARLIRGIADHQICITNNSQQLWRTQEDGM